MKKHLFLFAAFGCIGITTEIFFTAIKLQIEGLDTCGNPATDWRLDGISYIWMFPIYGLAGIAFPPIIQLLSKYNVLLRMCAYAIGIMLVEFVTGFLLDQLTGQCPWEYKNGLHIMGYVQLEFFPLWAIFGLGIEKTHAILGRIDL